MAIVSLQASFNAAGKCNGRGFRLSVEASVDGLCVIVETEQQSLAIGKRGQNVRLAAKLVGWDIDIRSEEEMKREIATQMEQMIPAPIVKLSSIEGISISDSDALAVHRVGHCCGSSRFATTTAAAAKNGLTRTMNIDAHIRVVT